MPHRTARPIDPGDAVPLGVAAEEPAPLDAVAETALENREHHCGGATGDNRGGPRTPLAPPRDARASGRHNPQRRQVSLYSALITWQWNPLVCTS
jgi:hypothetical protein